MKIAFLNIYSGLVNRGAESVVHELADRLGQRHQVMVFQGGIRRGEPMCPPLEGGQTRGSAPTRNYQTVTIPNIKIISTAPSSNLFDKLLHRLYLDPYNRQVANFTKACVPYLLQQKFDFIFPINGLRQLQELNKVRSQLKSKIIYVNQAQFSNSIFRQAGWDNWLKLWCKPDVFVCLTDKMYQWANKYALSSTKVVKIPNGVDLDKFNPRVKAVKVDLPRPLILCVAGLQKYKRVDLLIRAVARLNLNNESERVSLLILGNGELQQELEVLGNTLIGESNFQIKSVPYEQMPGFYAACDLFSLPSADLEAFGVSYLEAMACGKPVVAPNDATRREIVGDGELFVDVSDEVKYSEVLLNSLQIKWGSKPRLQAEKFDWKKVVRQYDKILDASEY